MKKIPTQINQQSVVNGEKGHKLQMAFSPNLIAQFCYYKGIDVCEFINFETCSTEQLKEIIKEMTQLLIEVGEEYRNSRK